MVTKQQLSKIKKMYDEGIDKDTIALQFDLSLDEIDNIFQSFEENIEEDKGNRKKDIEERMEKNAESSITGEIVRRTKGQALAIQKVKEEIGDYIYHLFDNTGLPVEDMAGFVEFAVDFFVEYHSKIEEMKKKLDMALEIIEELYEIADEQAERERLVKDYLTKCAMQGTPVDTEFVKKILFE